MLILNRKEGQSVVIGDGIEIVVVSVEGNQIKLGINAPRSVKVYRKELLESIQEQNKASVPSSINFTNLK